MECATVEKQACTTMTEPVSLIIIMLLVMVMVLVVVVVIVMVVMMVVMMLKSRQWQLY